MSETIYFVTNELNTKSGDKFTRNSFYETFDFFIENTNSKFWQACFMQSHAIHLFDYLQNGLITKSNYLMIDINDLGSIDRNSTVIYSVGTHYELDTVANNIVPLCGYISDVLSFPNSFILLDGSYEAESLVEPINEHGSFISNIHRNISNMTSGPNVDPSQIIYLSNSLIAEDENAHWNKYNQPEHELKVYSLLYDCLSAKVLYPNRKISADTLEETKSKNMHYFLKLNRSVKFERDLTTAFLIKTDLMSKSLVSHRHADPAWGKNYGLSPEVSEFVEFCSDRKALAEALPLDIDLSDTINRTQGYDANLKYDHQHYDKTFMSIVCSPFPERTNSIQCSASTIYPMYFYHPFILIGNRHSIKKLKEHGFKTFSKWFDESYDEEECMLTRMMMACKEIKRLGRLPPSTWRKMIKEMTPVLEHNANYIERMREVVKMDNIFTSLATTSEEMI